MCYRTEGLCLCVRKDKFEPFTSDGRKQGLDQQEQDCKFTCKLLCCKCSFCYQVATKERRNSQLLSQFPRNKVCERCPSCCYRSTCRGQTAPVLRKIGSSGGKSQGSNSTQRGLHPPLPVRAQLDQITNCHKQLCKSPQEPALVGDPASAGEQKCSRTGSNSKITAFLQQTIFGTQTQQLSETHLGPEHLEHLSKHRVVQNGDTREIRISLQTGEWVTSIDFKDAYFHIQIHNQSRKYMHFHVQGRSYQFKVLPFGLSTVPMEYTVVAKEVKLMALQSGIRIHQYLDDWLGRATSHQTCLQHTQTLVALCRELGWLVNKEKSELDPNQVFNFVGYQFDLRARSDPHQNIGRPQQTRFSQYCPVRCVRSGSSCPS